jgi:hypothetical protein
VNRWSRLSAQTCSPRATRAGKRSGGSERKNLAEPAGQDLELVGPVHGRVQAEVDLGQHVVQDQVLELLFVVDVSVEGAGDDPQAGGQAAHGEGLDAVVGDDGQGLGDHPLVGELAAAVLVLDRRVEPQRAGGPVAGGCAGCHLPSIDR